MTKRRSGPMIAVAVVLLAVAALAVVLTRFGPYDPIGFIDGSSYADTASIARGKAGYETYCASCHGKLLQGQPGWKNPLPNGRLPAPPHDASGHTWHHPDAVLAGITRRGLKPYVSEDYESDMPAFAGTLTDEQIGGILSYIKSTWPERERGYQKQMTDQTPRDPAAPSPK